MNSGLKKLKAHYTSKEVLLVFCRKAVLKILTNN